MNIGKEATRQRKRRTVGVLNEKFGYKQKRNNRQEKKLKLCKLSSAGYKLKPSSR